VAGLQNIASAGVTSLLFCFQRTNAYRNRVADLGDEVKGISETVSASVFLSVYPPVYPGEGDHEPKKEI
jgi:hypothetical protein